jgi:hypothetical protein
MNDVNKWGYPKGIILRNRRNGRRYIVEEVTENFDDCIDCETFYLRQVLGADTPYGPAQPRTIEQLDRLYVTEAPA